MSSFGVGQDDEPWIVPIDELEPEGHRQPISQSKESSAKPRLNRFVRRAGLGTRTRRIFPKSHRRSTFNHNQTHARRIFRHVPIIYSLNRRNRLTPTTPRYIRVLGPHHDASTPLQMLGDTAKRLVTIKRFDEAVEERRPSSDRLSASYKLYISLRATDRFTRYSCSRNLSATISCLPSSLVYRPPRPRVIGRSHIQVSYRCRCCGSNREKPGYLLSFMMSAHSRVIIRTAHDPPLHLSYLPPTHLSAH